MNEATTILAVAAAALWMMPQASFGDAGEPAGPGNGSLGEMTEPAKPFTWHGGDGTALSIPPPAGFSSVRDGTPLSDFFRKLAESDSENLTHAFWIDLSPDGEEVVGNAYVKEIKALRGNRLTSAEFRSLAGKAASADIADPEAIDKNISAVNDALQDDGANLKIGGFRKLPPHRIDDDRIAFTMVISSNDGADRSTTANTMCFFLRRGHVLSFYLSREAEDPDSPKEAVDRSRSDMNAWCDAIAAANDHLLGNLSSDFPGATLSANDEFARLARQENADRSRGSGGFLGKVLVCALVGGLFGLIRSVFKNGRRKSTEEDE